MYLRNIWSGPENYSEPAKKMTLNESSLPSNVERDLVRKNEIQGGRPIFIRENIKPNLTPCHQLMFVKIM